MNKPLGNGCRSFRKLIVAFKRKWRRKGQFTSLAYSTVGNMQVWWNCTTYEELPQTISSVLECHGFSCPSIVVSSCFTNTATAGFLVKEPATLSSTSQLLLCVCVCVALTASESYYLTTGYTICTHTHAYVYTHTHTYISTHNYTCTIVIHTHARTCLYTHTLWHTPQVGRQRSKQWFG